MSSISPCRRGGIRRQKFVYSDQRSDPRPAQSQLPLQGIVSATRSKATSDLVVADSFFFSHLRMGLLLFRRQLVVNAVNQTNQSCTSSIPIVGPARPRNRIFFFTTLLPKVTVQPPQCTGRQTHP